MWYWLVTSTTYGTWLPGDARGSVTSVRDYRATDATTRYRVEHDKPGEAWEPPVLGLRRSAMTQLKGPPVLLTGEQAIALLTQFRASATLREWRLLAAAIMSNHFHLVVSTAVDFEPAKILQEFKANGSRLLNTKFERPRSGTWWTKGGSKRKLPDERAVDAAINYVLHKQPDPLVTWRPDHRSD